MPATDIEISFLPEEKGFTAMVETMKQSTRAFALFDIAKLVLNKPERHMVRLSRKPAADGTRLPLFVVLPSESPFFRQEEAVRYALRRHSEMIYKTIQKPIDPPKGNFNFVNKCGFTGEWLGPPNYHEYPARLVRHHQQKLSHVPFEEFKSRIQTIKAPEAVKAWLESMSSQTEYQCILDPEPVTLSSLDELEKHFVEKHLEQFVTSGAEVRISGTASRQIQHHGLLEAIRETWQSERRFPLKTANEFRGRLRHEGFHFFKDPKGLTYLSRIKPKRFESITGLTEHVQRIISFLRANQRCHRKQLFEHLLASQPVPPAGAPMPAEEMLLADLHWLIQDGYVVEFSDGRLWALEDKPPPPPTPPAPEAKEISTATPPATDPPPSPAA